MFMVLDFLCLLLTALLNGVISWDVYRIVHPVLGYIFAVCVAFHVFLNWSWIRNTLFKK